MKVVINTCFGGFGLSPKAQKFIADAKGVPCIFKTYKPGNGLIPTVISFDEALKSDSLFTIGYTREDDNADSIESLVTRTDPDLIRCVETLGEEADGRCASLKIVEIPDDVQYIIEEYDGQETIAEVHRTWC